MRVSTINRARVFSKTLATISLAASALLLTACSDDDDHPALVCTGNIAEIADCEPNFSTLYAAVQQAGLGTALSTGDLTVFAPTNAAFTELFDDLGVSANDFLQRSDLANILQYHVLASAVDAAAATSLAQASDPTTTTLETSTIRLSLDANSNLFVNRSQVTSADITADNGVIHAVNKVLIPPNTFNLAETAQADGRFDTLVAAVVQANLAGTLSNVAAATVFAPTDDAFADLIANNDAFNSPADILALSNLGDILTYHVLGSEVNSATALGLAGNTTTPLNTSADLAISLSGPELYINTSRVITSDPLAFDVDASNGIIHAIDKVLLPPSPSALSNTSQTIAARVTELAGLSTGAEFTTLLAALSSANLAGALGGVGPFTVFAPTDAAFAALNLNAQNVASTPNLATILQQHVVSGSEIDAISAYAANGTQVTTLANNQLDVNIVDGALEVENATVTITDVETSSTNSFSFS